jgi:hypothetical protein
MAKLIVSILSSLDGYCAGPGGTLAGLPTDAAFDTHNLDCLRRAGTLLFGATTFPMFEAYWPHVDRGPGSEPVQREIAERVAAAGKLLVSDRLGVRADSPWAGTEVIPRAQAQARIAQLKAAPGPAWLSVGRCWTSADWQDRTSWPCTTTAGRAEPRALVGTPSRPGAPA